MTVLVAGGSGFVGRRRVDALTASDADVRVMSRSPSNARADRARQVVVTDRSFEQITHHIPMHFDDAVDAALDERKRR